MKKWKEVERELVAGRLREIALEMGEDGVREFIWQFCTSQTEFYGYGLVTNL